MSFGSRKSLYDKGPEKGEGLVGTVTGVERAPNASEQKVKVKFKGRSQEDAVYVPKKYTRNLKPEHTYEFHLDEVTFRGGEGMRLAGAAMIRRTQLEPTEVKSSGIGKRSPNGRDASSSGGFSSRAAHY